MVTAGKVDPRTIPPTRPAPLGVAEEIARAFAEGIRAACERIEIAGSVRRRKAHCTDIDLVAIPIRETNLVGEASPAALEAVLSGWVAERRVVRLADGPKLKKLLLPAARNPLRVDLHLVWPETWGVMLAIWTGPADYSQAIVTNVSRGGLLAEGVRISGGRVVRPVDERAKTLNDPAYGEWEALPTPEERDYLDGYAGGWREPWKRVPPKRWIRSSDGAGDGG